MKNKKDELILNKLNRKLDEEYERVKKVVVGRNHSCILCESKVV